MFEIFKRETKEKSFWEIIKLIDWNHQGNDDKVIAPVVNYLSKQGNDFIFLFNEQMAEYLHAIDGTQWAESYKKSAGVYSDDGFLYCRCVAIINGEEYYNSIKNVQIELNGDLEFESLLYIPALAWAKRNNCKADGYPYLPKTSYESGSNAKMWGNKYYEKTDLDIVGVYITPESPDVKLIEIIVKCSPSDVEIEKFTQEEDGQPQSNWQVAYDEQYLNEDGTEVIGGFGSIPADAPLTRVAFFMYFVNFDKLLLSQFGEHILPADSPIPERLKMIITFEPID